MPRGMQLCNMSMQAQPEGQEALLAPTMRCPGVHLSMGMSSSADKGGGEMELLCVLR